MKRPKFCPGQDYYWFCERFLHYITDSECAQIPNLPLGKCPRARCSWRRFRKFYKHLCDNKNYKYHDWYGYEKLDYSKHEHPKPHSKELNSEQRIRRSGMTVKELIEKLKQAKPDIDVVIERYNTDHYGDIFVENVHLYDDYIHTTNDMFIIDIKAEGLHVDTEED